MDDFAWSRELVGDDVGLVVVEGELDMVTVHPLEQALHELRQSVKEIVFDFSAVTFIDSSGIGLLVREQKRQSARLHLVASRRPVLQVLRLTDLDEFFVVHPDRESAVAAVMGNGRRTLSRTRAGRPERHI